MGYSTEDAKRQNGESREFYSNNLRILHVDDNEQDHELTHYKLKRLADDLEIEWVKSGQQALKKLENGRYNCVLSDFQMPEMDGLEFLSALRDAGNHTPFVFLTGQGNEEIAAEALRAGADDYFTKDAFFAHYERLINSIRRLVALRHQAEAKERAEQALKESQRVLSTLMSNLPGMAYRCDCSPEWTMRFVSEGCYDLTGYRRNELMDDAKVTYSDLIHPDDRDMVWREVQDAINENRHFTLQYRIITAEGEEKWVWERGRLVRLDDGSADSLEGFVTDVSYRMRAELALQESEERFRLAFHTSPDAISITRMADGRYVDINEGFMQLTGYSREEIIDKSSLELHIWERDEDRAHVVERLLKDGEIRNFEAEYRMKDGSVRKGVMMARVLLLKGEEHILSITREAEA